MSHNDLSLLGNILSKDDVSFPSQDYLSKSVMEFRPASRHQPESIPVNTLTQRSREFLEQYVLCWLQCVCVQGVYSALALQECYTKALNIGHRRGNEQLAILAD